MTRDNKVSLTVRIRRDLREMIDRVPADTGYALKISSIIERGIELAIAELKAKMGKKRAG